MGVKNKLADVKAKDVVAFIKQAGSVSAAAAHYDVSLVALYNKFGDDIRGLIPRGRKAGATAAPKAKGGKKAPAKPAPKKGGKAKAAKKATKPVAKKAKGGVNAKVKEVAPGKFEIQA